jgi:hypothetical protein
MSEKTISVDVPEGFEFVREGNVCFFRRLSKDFSVWKSKYNPVGGYFVSIASEVCETIEPVVGSGRSLDDRNVFFTSEQAVGSRALAMLSQQLADVIVRNCTRWNFVLEIEESKNRCHFLAFKTREDAEEFLKENLDELFDAGIFI